MLSEKQFVQAFNDLNRRLYHYAQTMGKDYMSDQQAEDVVADVFAEIWKLRHIQTFENDAALSSYLFLGVKNRCFNLHKWKSRNTNFCKGYIGSVETSESFLEAVEIKTELVAQILAGKYKRYFTDGEHEALILRYKKGLNGEEIAAYLNKSGDTVRVLLARALTIVKELLKVKKPEKAPERILKFKKSLPERVENKKRREQEFPEYLEQWKTKNAATWSRVRQEQQLNNNTPSNTPNKTSYKTPYKNASYHQNYYILNKAKFAAYSKEYREKNKVEIKKYREKRKQESLKAKQNTNQSFPTE